MNLLHFRKYTKNSPKGVKTFAPHILLFAVFLSAVMIFPCCAEEDAQENDNQNNQRKAIPIRVAKSAKAEFTDQIELKGTFFPYKEANLGTSMPGRIEKFHFPQGAFVNKGDLLAELSAELKTQAIIELNALKRDYQRLARLKDRGSVSQMDYDHLKARLEASEVKTEMLEKNTSIIAPFSGIIVEYLVEEGENFFFNINIEPGYSHTSGILRLMQINPLKVVVEVNERELQRIHVGKNVKVICEAFDENLELNGHISFIKPKLSTITRTARVEIKVQNPQNRIFPGMFARVIIDTEEHKGVKVPLNAIYRQPGTPEDYVYKIENDTAYRIAIERRKVFGDMIFVEGIEKDIKIATEGKNRLIHGSHVKVIENEL